MVSEDSFYHINRRKEIELKYPEVKNLQGPYYPSIIFIVILVLIQLCLGFYIQKIEMSWWLVGICSYINANTLFYSLTTFIHENSHGLVLGWKYRWLCAIIIEIGTVSFGDQWVYTQVHYYLHHPHLNDKSKDSECPRIGHVSNLPENNKYLYSILELFPLGFLLNGTISNTKKKKKSSSYIRYVLLFECILIVLYHAYHSNWLIILFNIWSISLFASRWCISHHGQSISEHYSEFYNKNKPTQSTYLFMENIIGFNTGYHDEHHTFPKIPWSRLPTLKKIAAKDFNNINHIPYYKLWFNWFKHGFSTDRFRYCN